MILSKKTKTNKKSQLRYVVDFFYLFLFFFNVDKEYHTVSYFLWASLGIIRITTGL